MIAAVAAFSLEYFSTIELIAFSYAISGCCFLDVGDPEREEPLPQVPEAREEAHVCHGWSFREIAPLGADH